jgi:hypothetical protein
MGVDELVTGGSVTDPVVDSIDTDELTINTTGARVNLTSSQTASDATTTKIEFNNVVFDKGDEWDDTNYQFEPNNDGIYLAEVTLTPIGADVADGDKIAVKCRVNGGDVFEGVNLAGASDAFSGQVLGLLDLSSSDVVSAFVFYDQVNNNDVTFGDSKPRLNHFSLTRVA